jgi:hypothetical protein
MSWNPNQGQDPNQPGQPGGYQQSGDPQPGDYQQQSGYRQEDTNNNQAINLEAINNNQAISHHTVCLLRLFPIQMVLLLWAWMPMLKQG